MPVAIQFTPEQEERLRGAESHARLADAFGCSDMPIRRWRRAHGWSPQPNVLAATPDEPPALDEAVVLRDEVRQLRAQLRRTDKAAIGDERVLRAIEAAVDRVEPVYVPPIAVVPHGAEHGRLPEHRQAAIWSDWHYGETVNAESVNGLGGYNVAICEERVAELVESILSFKKHRAALTGLDIWMLGDMASGKIHRLEETNEVPAQEQYVRVGYLMADAIRRLAPHYADIHVSCTWGNHPRDTPEPSTSHSNGDWVAYELARALTRDLTHVEWNIPRAGMVVRRFCGLNVLLWHGDGVKSNMPGVPWGGVLRRWTTLKATFAQQGVMLDYLAVGHYHQANVVADVFMNGALVGTNTHGLKNFGGGQRPKQLLIHGHHEHGIVDVAYCTPRT